jgi:hypothetical protein
MRFFARPSGRHFVLPGSRGKRLVAAAAAGVTGIAMTTVLPAPAGAAPAPAAVVAQADPTEAADEATAMRLAWKHRKPVEILDQRTESSETYAQPDGTLRTRQFSRPTRVHRDNAWVSVDTRLKAENGVVKPAATTLDMRFSDGGTDPMLTIVKDGKSLSMTWPFPLPPPTLLESTATYSEVLPGVDLQLTASVDSFSQILIVKSPLAAQHSAVRRLQFGIAAQGVALRQEAGGVIKAADDAGNPIFVSDGARMWDKPQKVKPPDITPPPAPGEGLVAAEDPAPTPEPLPTLQADLPVEVAADSLTIIPSPLIIDDPTAKWPVYIDPGFNGGSEIWTHVSRKSPTKSFWSDSNRDTMRVGQVWQAAASDDWRTLVQFNVTKLKGASIKRASVLVNVKHSASCALTPFQLWRTNAISKSSSVTWNSTKDKWWKVLGEVKAMANKSSCPKGNDEVEFSQAAVKSAFQDAATKNYGTVTLAFRAKSESDNYQWKKLVPGSTYLDIEYNHKPGKPSNLAFSPCYVSCAINTAVTSTKRPTLGMRSADPNGGALRYEFEVYAADKKTLKAKSGTTVTGVASGGQRTWSLKSDLPDGSYFWRGKGCDTYECGPYSDWFGFKVDATNPKNPTVTSTAYPATGWHGNPGVGGSFTFSPGSTADAVKRYAYSLNGAAETTLDAPANGVLTRTLVPTKDLVNTLRVKSIDTAGNLSGAVDYLFKVRPVGAAWYWSLDEGTGNTAQSAPEANRPLTVSGTGVTWSEAGKDGAAAASFAGTGELSTASPVFDTLSPSGFTVAAWVRLPAPPATDAGEETDPGEVPEPPPGSGDDPEGGATPSNEEQEALPSPLPKTNRVAVSQDGRATSMFSLGYRADRDLDGDSIADPAWCFTLRAQDVANAATTDACTASYVEAGAWVHLAATVDPTANRVRLYVNGIPARDGVLAEVTGKATWEATGKFAVGRGWNAAAAADRWIGEIDEVHVTPRVWTEQEIYEKSHVVDGTQA